MTYFLPGKDMTILLLLVKGRGTMMFLKLRFSFHQFMSKYNEALMEDAICPDLKKKLAAKAR